MHLLDDKQFKKNSMSYLRIMWLLREMQFDIAHLDSYFHNIKPKMDAHLLYRGPWQKSMFSRYYDFFKYAKPKSIQHTEKMTGTIGQALAFSKYKRSTAYRLTHQVFVAFDYGAKKHQTRFTPKELTYIKEILPKITTYCNKKQNWDLLAEVLTCMVYLKQTDHPLFKESYAKLFKSQNTNGSWGNYEKKRAKYGKDTDIKYYLHTTGVVIELLSEYENGDW